MKTILAILLITVVASCNRKLHRYAIKVADGNSVKYFYTDTLKRDGSCIILNQTAIGEITFCGDYVIIDRAVKK